VTKGWRRYYSRNREEEKEAKVEGQQAVKTTMQTGDEAECVWSLA
jgi:hypothetical protein